MTDAEYAASLKTNIAQQNELFAAQKSAIDDLSGKLMEQTNSITEIQQLPVLQPATGSSSKKYILLAAAAFVAFLIFRRHRDCAGSCRRGIL